MSTALTLFAQKQLKQYSVCRRLLYGALACSVERCHKISLDLNLNLEHAHCRKQHTVFLGIHIQKLRHAGLSVMGESGYQLLRYVIVREPKLIFRLNPIFSDIVFFSGWIMVI